MKPLKIKRAPRPPVDLWRPIRWVPTHRLGTTALGQCRVWRDLNLQHTELKSTSLTIRPRLLAFRHFMDIYSKLFSHQGFRSCPIMQCTYGEPFIWMEYLKCASKYYSLLYSVFIVGVVLFKVVHKKNDHIPTIMKMVMYISQYI